MLLGKLNYPSKWVSGFEVHYPVTEGYLSFLIDIAQMGWILEYYCMTDPILEASAIFPLLLE